MGGHGAMDDDNFGYDEDPARANNAEFGEAGVDATLAAMAETVADEAGDAEEALAMCQDLRAEESLDDEQYQRLLALVEASSGWDLGREELT
jgi:hypothetical protein